MDTDNTLIDEFNQEKKRIKALYKLNILDTPYEEQYDTITRIASYVCGTPISFISLLDKERQWFKSRLGIDVAETSREVSFCNHTILGDELMEVRDTQLDARFKENPLVTGEPNIRFYAGSPLVTSAGEKIGTICVVDVNPRQLSKEQKECLDGLAKQVMILIESKYQVEKLKKVNQKLARTLKKRVNQYEKTLKLFTRFVPDKVVAGHLNAGLEGPEDGELKYHAIMFCDIRGYTSMVEHLSPKVAVAILKIYYNLMSEVIDKHQGVVNQYVGDEIFSSFTSPAITKDYEKNAVFCAIGMIKALKKINRFCKVYTPEPLKVGIGIHAGDVFTGTLGSDNKIEYTVTGDTVNTAKRIEALTQKIPNTILISDTVYEKVKEWIDVEELEPIEVKGKEEPVKIYKVLGKKEA